MFNAWYVSSSIIFYSSICSKWSLVVRTLWRIQLVVMYVLVFCTSFYSRFSSMWVKVHEWGIKYFMHVFQFLFYSLYLKQSFGCRLIPGCRSFLGCFKLLRLTISFFVTLSTSQYYNLIHATHSLPQFSKYVRFYLS